MDSINEMIIRSLFNDSDILIREGLSLSSLLTFIERFSLSVIACIIIYKLIRRPGK